MALVADNVRIALTGALYVAPVGTTLPTDETTSWDAAFVDLGYLSDDGVAMATDDDGGDKIKAWQNGDVVRTTSISRTHTVKGTLIETTAKGLELYYGATVTNGAGGSAIAIGSPNLKRYCFGVDVVDGDEAIRYVIPSGAVTEVGDLQFTNGDPVGYEITITAHASAGVALYRYQGELP